MKPKDRVWRSVGLVLAAGLEGRSVRNCNEIDHLALGIDRWLIL